MIDLIQKPGLQFIARLGDDNGLFDLEIPRIGEADADIKIGGDDPSNFQSEIRASKWDGEYGLRIRNPLMPLRSDVKTFENGTITIIDETKGIKERYFVTNQKNPGLEYEMEFASQPPSEIRLNIEHSDGFRFGQQNLKNFIPGSEYDAHIPGSWAVYIPKGNNKYRTGKFCHFYMPEFIEIGGLERRGFAKEFWIENGEIIIVPPDWTRNTVYPIILDPDPTIGYTTNGSSKLDSIDYLGVCKDNTTTDASGGDISTFHYYIDDAYDGRKDGRAGVYDGFVNGADLISNNVTLAAGNQVAGWNAFAMTGTLAASTDYYPTMASESGGPGITYDADIGDNHFDTSFTFADVLSDPMAENPADSDHALSIYVTYAAAGPESYTAAGSMGSSGVLTRFARLYRALTGALPSAGALTRFARLNRVQSGFLGLSSSLSVHQPHSVRTLSGSLGLSGRGRYRSGYAYTASGSLGLSGAYAQRRLMAVAGSLGMSGDLERYLKVYREIAAELGLEPDLEAALESLYYGVANP